MEQQEKTKNPVGRPRTSQMKDYHYKAEGDLIPLLDKVENRNSFINAAVREKAQREGLIKKRKMLVEETATPNQGSGFSFHCLVEREDCPSQIDIVKGRKLDIALPCSKNARMLVNYVEP